MRRSDFIKILGIGATGVVLPNNTLLNQHNVKIYDNYIKGVAHYKYKNTKTIIKEGDSLLLKREPENQYDAFAIAVFYENYKLGYIAAYENVVLANMLDQNVTLDAYVSKHQQKASSFECLAIEVFTQLVSPSSKLVNILQTEYQSDDANDIYRKGFY